MRSAVAAVLLVAACAGTASTATAPSAPERIAVTDVEGAARPRVLCVVAHPDDEIAFAGTLYKTASFLGGACDLFTITNGEGGFKYATLAEGIYGRELTDESVGRRELPAIRKRELAAGCRWLGVRDIWFLGERDHRYTQDLAEVLETEEEESQRNLPMVPGGPRLSFRRTVAWDVARIRSQLRSLLAKGGYDFVLVHQPVVDTHAHHKAASILGTISVAEMPPESRPVLLGVRVVSDGEPERAAPAALPDWPSTAPASDAGPFVFDRRQRFGHQGKLDYRVVVNWAVAEHKSQGTMQLSMNRGDREEYRLFRAARTEGDAARAAAWFADLAKPQFGERVYGDSAGTNAAPR